ncbi:MAG: hypothetical protein QXT86_08815 [Archaeoglobaceae archaeon]
MDVDKILERVKFLTESYLYEGKKPSSMRRGARLTISWHHLEVLVATCRDYLDKIDISIPLLASYEGDPKEVLNRKKMCHKMLVQVLDLLSKIYYHIRMIGDEDAFTRGVIRANQELLQEEGGEEE